MTLRNCSLITNLAFLLLGFATLGVPTFSQVQKSAPATQAVKPGLAASPTPTPTTAMKPASPQAKPGVAPAISIPPQPPIAPATKPTAATGAAANLAGADVDQMTSQQFRALPPTGMVRYKGKSMTKSSFIDQRNKEFLAQHKQTKATPNFEAAKTQFEQKQAADLAAKNARVKAVAEKYSLRMKQLAATPPYTALNKEADEIVQRYPSASASEKATLKRRAAEIHNRLQRMEQGAVAGR